MQKIQRSPISLYLISDFHLVYFPLYNTIRSYSIINILHCRPKVVKSIGSIDKYDPSFSCTQHIYITNN